MVLFEEPPELLALEIRGALDQLGEMVGAVYTDDLLERIFSRFCIGK
jgi:tRNA modification GTPase